jgi:molybdate transport system ATP-binding protein
MIDHAVLETTADEVILDIDVKARFGDFDLAARFTAPGGLTALFGRSGAGKTSLVNLLAGLARPIAGHIRVGGAVLFDAAQGIDLPPEKRRVGYVFQDARLFPHLSVAHNLTYGMNRVPPGERRHGFDQVVALLELEALLTRRPAGLSGGEKQRVAIGRALLASPRLLLMDEPLSALDAARKNEIMPFIERLRDDMRVPIVYVSHALDDVVRLADIMVILSGGRVVAEGEVEDIMSRLDLRPLTGRYEAGAVLAAVVIGEDRESDLSTLSFGAGELLVPRLDLPRGAPLRVRVRARDVSLSLSRPIDSSVLNIFKGTIIAIEDSDGPYADVLINIGAPLIARITRRSLKTLGLRPGKAVYASIKASAIDRRSVGLGGTRRRRH